MHPPKAFGEDSEDKVTIKVTIQVRTKVRIKVTIQVRMTVKIQVTIQVRILVRIRRGGLGED